MQGSAIRDSTVELAAKVRSFVREKIIPLERDPRQTRPGAMWIATLRDGAPFASRRVAARSCTPGTQRSSRLARGEMGRRRRHETSLNGP